MFLRVISLFWILSSPLFAQEVQAEATKFKVGKVDLQKIFENFSETAQVKREIDHVRAQIQRESQEELGRLQDRSKELREAYEKFQDESTKFIERESIKEDIPVLNRELKMLEKRRLSLQKSKNQQLNIQMTQRLGGLMGQIVTLVQKVAEEQGFDMVYDSSGATDSQFPPILFGKDVPDLTAVIIGRLAKISEEKK